MRTRELLALGVMALWIVAGVMLMNRFGFQGHMHDPVWSLGAAIALLIILVGGVAIFFVIAKETPWIWFNKKSDS